MLIIGNRPDILSGATKRKDDLAGSAPPLRLSSNKPAGTSWRDRAKTDSQQ